MGNATPQAKVRWVHCACLAVGVVYFWFGMGINAWGVINPRLFHHFQQDNEGMLAGRVLRAEDKGLFSDAGQMGVYAPNRPPRPNDYTFVRQHSLVSESGLDDARAHLVWQPYESHPAAQAILGAWISRMVRLDQRMGFLHGLNALITAVTFVLLSAGARRLAGIGAGLGVFVVLAISYFPLQLGTRVYWQLWSFYLPMAGVWWCLRRRPDWKWRLSALVTGAILLKILFSGFEFMTCALLMPLLPVLFEAQLNKGLKWKRPLWLILTGLGIGTLVGLGVLLVQLSETQGGLSPACELIAHKLSKRTTGLPGLGDAATYRDLMPLYGKAVLIDLNPLVYVPWAWARDWLLTIRTWQLLWASVLVAGALLFYRHKAKAQALLTLLCCSLPVSFSWIIIFKAHSFTHDHMNQIIWYMPFCLVTAAAAGYLLETLANRWRMPN